MTPEILRNQKERLRTDDTYLMLIIEYLISYHESALTSGDPNAKPLWKGHAAFMTSVLQWWKNKGYISLKQKVVLLKQLEKYDDRIEQIITDTTEDDTINSEYIFNKSEFDDFKCPVCGERKLNAIQTLSDEIRYLCGKCSAVITYVENDTEDELPPTASCSGPVFKEHILKQSQLGKYIQMAGEMIIPVDKLTEIITQFVSDPTVSTDAKFGEFLKEYLNSNSTDKS